MDQEEDDCTIYIEELKSDDPNLKMNAVIKITSIADILGSTRVRDELLPYLIEIIEELDNEDEFLLKLADQVLQLMPKIGGKEFTHLLIAPLEILSSMEEPSVREKSVECLIQIAQNQSKTFYSEHFLPMIRQLAGWDNYPSRISACSLLGSCYTFFDQDERKEIIQLFQELCRMFRDDTPMVRRTAASNISKLCKVMDKQLIKQDILPMWALLMGDDIDSVKSKNLESSILLADKLVKKDVAEGIVPKLKETCSLKNANWRIRYAVAEILGQLIQYLEKAVVRGPLYSIFEELLKDSEHEVRSITIDQLPSICDQLSDQILVDSVQPILNTLLQDSSQHVRTSLAEVICRIAGCFDKKNVISGLIPIIETLLKDDILDVRLAIIKNINLLNTIIGSEAVKKHIIPMFNNIIAEKQWRYRLAFCEFMPRFYKQLGEEQFKEIFTQYINAFFVDHFAAIRDQNFENLKEIAEENGFDKIKTILFENLDQIILNQNYIFRVSAIAGLHILKSVMKKSDINEYFQKVYEIGFKDSVPNVTIRTFKTYFAVKDLLDAHIAQKCISLAKELNDNQDSEIAYNARLVD